MRLRSGRDPATAHVQSEHARRKEGIYLFRLTALSEGEIQRFISEQSESNLSYPEVGATALGVPSGYNIDHNRIQLGRGEAAWQRAVQRFAHGKCSGCRGSGSIGRLLPFRLAPTSQFPCVTLVSVH